MKFAKEYSNRWVLSSQSVQLPFQISTRTSDKRKLHIFPSFNISHHPLSFAPHLLILSMLMQQPQLKWLIKYTRFNRWMALLFLYTVKICAYLQRLQHIGANARRFCREPNASWLKECGISQKKVINARNTHPIEIRWATKLCCEVQQTLD